MCGSPAKPKPSGEGWWIPDSSIFSEITRLRQGFAGQEDFGKIGFRYDGN
ncbi:MAG: hypothetical protein ACOY15_02005 [Pseudomonadota bacterium]